MAFWTSLEPDLQKCITAHVHDELRARLEKRLVYPGVAVSARLSAQSDAYYWSDSCSAMFVTGHPCDKEYLKHREFAEILARYLGWVYGGHWSPTISLPSETQISAGEAAGATAPVMRIRTVAPVQVWGHGWGTAGSSGRGGWGAWWWEA